MVDGGGDVGARRDRLDRRVGERRDGRVEPGRGGLEGRRRLDGRDGGDARLDGLGVRGRRRDGVVGREVGRAGALDARGGDLEELGDGGLRRERGPGLGDAVERARGGALEVGPGRRRRLLGVLDAGGDLLGGGAGGSGDAGGLEVLDGLLDLAEVGLGGRLRCEFFSIFIRREFFFFLCVDKEKATKKKKKKNR